jgi:hypothetical protein
MYLLIFTLAVLVGFMTGFVLANSHRDYTSEWWGDWGK